MSKRTYNEILHELGELTKDELEKDGYHHDILKNGIVVLTHQTWSHGFSKCDKCGIVDEEYFNPCVFCNGLFCDKCCTNVCNEHQNHSYQCCFACIKKKENLDKIKDDPNSFCSGCENRADKEELEKIKTERKKRKLVEEKEKK
jgi:hypothetical protein